MMSLKTTSVKYLALLLLISPFEFVSANNSDTKLLKEFHELGITHCDEFIQKNIQTKGDWKFFLSKHAGGLDGPTTEITMVQIYGDKKNSFKNDYTFVQTLKKCFLHKRGLITAQEPCSAAVNPEIWKIQFNLPGYSFKRYRDKKGIVLYSNELSPNQCLIEYEFRTKGEHSPYKPIK